MKSNNISYLALYEKWSESSELPGNGLCNNLPVSDEFSLLHPSEEDLEHLKLEDKSLIYWASEISEDASPLESEVKWFGFTPLRQNIVLFLAAMNNEL